MAFAAGEARDAQGRWVAGGGGSGLSDAEAADFEKRDARVGADHDKALVLHDRIAKKMQELKDLHGQLDEHLGKAQDNLNHVNDLMQKNGDTPVGNSEVLDTLREANAHVGEAVAQHASDTEDVAAAKKTWTRQAKAPEVDTAKVAEHVDRLTRTAGTEHFGAALDDARKLSASEIKAVAKQVVGSATSSKSGNLKNIGHMHQALVVFKRKGLAVGGRSAA